MGLFIALVVWSAQEPRVPIPPDADRSVPLEAARPVAKTDEPKLLLDTHSGSRRLVDRPESTGPSLGNFFFWSFVVLALLVGAFVLFKRFAKGSRFFRASTSIDVLARRALAPRQEIMLVDIGGRVLVLGSTRDRISTLGEIADPDEVARLRAKIAGGSPDAAEKVFGESLRSGLKDYEKGPDPEKKGRVDGVFEELAALKKTVQAWRA